MQHERDMRGLLPIDEACARLAASLWNDYASAKAEAPGIDLFVLGLVERR